MTWQSYALLPPSSHSDSYHSCQTSLCGEILPNRLTHRRGYVHEPFFCVCVCVCVCVCHFSQPQTDKEKSCIEGSELRSKTEKFCFNVHMLPLRLSSCLRTFTRSDTWQPETGKGLCVIAVKGTDQISHSTLNCHRSAKIKGEKLTGAVP